MKRHIGWLSALALLVLLAPLASRQPDPVQQLLKLPGSASSLLEAVAGILMTVTAVYLVFKLLILFRGSRPKT